MPDIALGAKSLPCAIPMVKLTEPAKQMLAHDIPRVFYEERFPRMRPSPVHP